MRIWEKYLNLINKESLFLNHDDVEIVKNGLMEENKYNRDAIINEKETKMSKKILIVEATGSIGNKLRKTLLEKTDYELTLFSTGAGSLTIDKNRERAIAGNVFND